MPLIGKLLKSALEITDKVIPEASPVSEQDATLKELLSKAKNTQLGKKYRFDDLLQEENVAAAFAANVPYHSYEQMYEQWWIKQIEGEENVSWPGKPGFYALTSGTTSNHSKHIPVTHDMLDAIRKTGRLQVLAMSNFNLPSAFFQSEIMMLSSSTDLVHDEKSNSRKGEISGISASNIPSWFKNFYRPGDEISAIDNWDERVEAIARCAPEWNIGALCGIPSWNELMLKKIIEYHGLKHIHEIWPNLQVFASGGVAFGPYQKTFNALMGKPITVIDTYLTSEGFLAYQTRPRPDMSMRLSTHAGIYFEFVPFKDENVDENGEVKPGAPALSLAQIEEGKDYVLVISTVSGAWRYMIGDTIRFTSKEHAEIIITGRTKHFLNVVGSQLSVMKMNDAMKKLEEKFDLRIPEFTVAAVKSGDDFKHHWYLGAEGTAGEEEVASALDDHLQQANKNYKVARNKALKGIQVTLVKPDVFYNWNEKQKKKGGQVKMSRVMKEDEFSEWKAFADKR
ncbi:MAG: GH3 auxin-responsive promoter family protein [Cyclobacteriaceae bacterium]